MQQRCQVAPKPVAISFSSRHVGTRGRSRAAATSKTPAEQHQAWPQPAVEQAAWFIANQRSELRLPSGSFPVDHTLTKHAQQIHSSGLHSRQVAVVITARFCLLSATNMLSDEAQCSSACHDDHQDNCPSGLHTCKAKLRLQQLHATMRTATAHAPEGQEHTAALYTVQLQPMHVAAAAQRSHY